MHPPVIPVFSLQFVLFTPAYLLCSRFWPRIKVNTTTLTATPCPPLVIASKPNKDLVNTSILRQPQLDTIQSNNIASLLEYLPGTSMVGSPRPGGQKINIWGLSDPEDVPVTVDGSLKTFDKYRQGFVFIEPELIKNYRQQRSA
ncbi:Plug domain-containing protein [Snodgrassella alvi]|uniref:Plug domain-containing protein n=1 Tax=Snodgrassella alvi TaxID=1196083 RepID=UPI00345F8D58